MVDFRRVGAVVLVIAAIAVWFGMKPSDSVAPEYNAVISAVLAEDEANQARTEGAPQQTVVNGWTARNLLAIIAKQGDSAPPSNDDQRPSALLALAVIGIALLLFTAGGAVKQESGLTSDTPSIGPNAESVRHLIGGEFQPPATNV